MPDQYKKELAVDSPVLKMLDRQRIGLWQERQQPGLYLQRHLHYYFIWDPVIHHQSPEYQLSKKRTQQSLSLSTKKCIERTRREHEALLGEFESLMAGLEPSLEATGTHPRRLSDHELFLELQRASNPLAAAAYPYRQGLTYESARSQVVSAAIEDEREEYFQMGGMLYSLITLKNPPDATFPGIMRELMKLEFPLVVATDVVIPDQTKIINYYKRQLLRMQAAQKDMKGNYKINVEAIVAEKQLIHTIEQIVSSSLKVCELNLTVAVRTSEKVRNDRHLEEQQSVLADRRSKVLTAIQRMNGAKALPETIAQKRIFVHTLSDAGQMDFAIDYRRSTPAGPATSSLKPAPVPDPLSNIPAEMLMQGTPVRFKGKLDSHKGVGLVIHDLYRTSDTVYIRYTLVNRLDKTVRVGDPSVVVLSDPRFRSSLLTVVHTQLGADVASKIKSDSSGVPVALVRQSGSLTELTPKREQIGLLSIKIPAPVSSMKGTASTVLRISFPIDQTQPARATLVL